MSTSLQEAYQYLDYEASLDFSPAAKANNSSQLYIEREGDQYEEIKFDLLNKVGYNKLLFTGHLGSGKSTELNRLANDQEIKDCFLVVYYTVKSVLDILNLDHIALLISLGAKSFEAAIDSNIKIDKYFLDNVLGWANTTKIIEKEDQELAGVDVALGIKAFFSKFLLRLKREHRTRESIKEVFEPRLSDLINFINEIMDGIRLGLDEGKDILVIIDDLEKISLPLADDIFFKYGSLLTQPKSKIVYTVPIALYYSPIFKNVMENMGTTGYVLPNIMIRTRTKGPHKAGYKRMREAVYKRLDRSLIDREALDEAIRNSGGVMRELIRILNTACRKAIIRKAPRINLEMVQAGVVELRNYYSRFLDDEHYELMLKTQETQNIAGADTKTLELLHTLSVLEYMNAEKWCDIHPVVEPLLDDFKKRREKK